MNSKKGTPPKPLRHIRQWRSTFLTGCAIVLLLVAAGFFMPVSGDREPVSSDVVINEVMSSNVAVCSPQNGQYYDWIELINSSSVPQNIAGWRLSDSYDLRKAYTLPNRTLQPGECLLVYAVGKSGAEGPNFAPFGLSAEGETLTLLNANGETVDSVRFPPLSVGETYARDPISGDWSITEEFTPGLANTHANYIALAEHALSNGDIVINELMPKNASTHADEDGDYSDWIELHNQSASAINLEGWALSDDVRNRRKWIFPNVEIGAGEYMIVFASRKDRTGGGPLHTNFSLNSDGESVYLFSPEGAPISRVQYDAMSADVSLSRQENGQYTTRLAASPDYANTPAGIRMARGSDYKNLLSNSAGLYINEVFAVGSQRGDWIELYNGSSTTLDLSGCGLSDDASRPLKWTFPEGANIAPGQYLLVAMDSDATAAYRASFGLSDGETLRLSDRNGTLVDRVSLYDQITGLPYGRASGYSQYRYLRSATPGAVNAVPSYEKRAAEVEFSVPGGMVHDQSVTVALSAEEGMTIFYTTDGSEPTVSSSTYTQPITVTETTILRAIAWKDGCLASPSAAASYLFGVSHGVRIIAVSGPADQLIGPSGILITGDKSPEVKVHAEMYEPDGTLLLSQDCGMSISGKMSRSQYGQKSFKLVARSEYGDNRLRAALFDNRPYTEYKSVMVRASGQDNNQTRMRDSILTSLAADLDLMYQETEVAVVYVNGVYWGEYNLRERISPHSIAQFMGWDDPENIDFLDSEYLTARQGSNAAFKSVMSAVKRYGLESDEYVEALRQYVDIENYLDYVALQMYTCNQDMNNLRLYRNALQDGLWRWIPYDLDLSYQIDQNSVSAWLTSGGVGSITKQDNSLFIALMKNEKMRDAFLTRMGDLLATTFSTENVLEKIQERYAVLQPEMAQHCARWDWDYSQWERFGREMVDYAKKRPAKLIGYFQKTLNLTDAQMEQYFGAALRKANGG